MEELSRFKQWLQDYGWIFIAILWWSSVFYAGYVIAGTIKEWAKSHIIIVKEIQ